MKIYRLHLVSGWSEGPWHFEQFIKALPDNIEPTDKPEAADIIVAHSSGCYSLPAAAKTARVVLIDPPYWPGKSIPSRVLKHSFIDAPKQIKRYGLHFWLALRAWNLVYACKNPSRHIKVWRAIKTSINIAAESKEGLLIHNTEDAYCSPKIADLSGLAGLKFIEMEGFHEDCWAYPERIIKQIEQSLD
jgi:hypothetical protein